MSPRLCLGLACLALGAALGGCSTPQAVRDQASNTAALAGVLDQELRAFRDVSGAIGKARLESIVRQEREIELAAHSVAFDERAGRLAGINPSPLMQQLLELADSRRKDEEALAKRLEESAKSLAATTSAVPVPSARLAALQKALSVLSEELSDKEWVKFVAGFVRQVRKELDEAKSQAQSTLGEAKQAPVQNTN